MTNRYPHEGQDRSDEIRIDKLLAENEKLKKRLADGGPKIRAPLLKLNESLTAENKRYRGALQLAAIRLEILTGRMRACHEETGVHELLDEAEMFCSEARQALGSEDDK